MKKVLIISTSPRKGGNSETLAEEFAGSVDCVGVINGHSALRNAYEMGKAV